MENANSVYKGLSFKKRILMLAKRKNNAELLQQDAETRQQAPPKTGAKLTTRILEGLKNKSNTKNENYQPLGTMTDAVQENREVADFDLRELSLHEAKTPPILEKFNQITKGVPTVNAHDLKEFLKLIAEGEQDQAEAMLKNNTALALLPGDVTDLSKRTFINITGFQYAVWALDWHMWTMIRKYLPTEAARTQMQEFARGSWVEGHGLYFNFETLISAYQTSIDLYSIEKYDAGNQVWMQQVGGAQRLLPAHVVNEYCHPTRPFYPVPNFEDPSALPRSRTIDAGEWFTASYNNGKLGERFACYRGTRKGGRWGLWLGCCSVVTATGAPSDVKSIRALATTRTAQREKLINELKLNTPLRPLESNILDPKFEGLAAEISQLSSAFQSQEQVSRLQLLEMQIPKSAISQEDTSSTTSLLTFSEQGPLATIETTTAPISQKDVAEFLKLVVEGEQEIAEGMLKRNPTLALMPGDVTDLSKRSFTNITGFQYAVWALDWHMWTMIRKYLPDRNAKLQAEGFETGSWVVQHGIHAKWHNLTEALQDVDELYKISRWKEGKHIWIHYVGGAQLLLPTHVINEYCHPKREFFPCPNFKAPLLPRSRITDSGEWFTAVHNQGTLGIGFGFWRGGRPQAVAEAGSLHTSCPELDSKALCVLANTRIAQRKELITELRTTCMNNTRIVQRRELITELRPIQVQKNGTR